MVVMEQSDWPCFALDLFFEIEFFFICAIVIQMDKSGATWRYLDGERKGKQIGD